jgi:hypothetical protein
LAPSGKTRSNLRNARRSTRVPADASLVAVVDVECKFQFIKKKLILQAFPSLRTGSPPSLLPGRPEEIGDTPSIADEIKATVRAYNEDDCRSAASLRDWLETQRAKLIAGERV